MIESWHESFKMPGEVKVLIGMALAEDIGTGDVTSLILSSTSPGTAEVLTRQRICVAGGPVAARVFQEVDPSLQVELVAAEGSILDPGGRLLTIRGARRPILTSERTALNFLGRLCGVATLTRTYVDAVAGTRARIVDTRKTLPGWRWLDKYAVRTGGGLNHRMGLYDGIIVKDNHIDALGGMEAVVDLFRRSKPEVPVAIEARSLEEARLAATLPPDLIMLDNLAPPAVRTIVEALDGRCPLEATGGVGLDTVADLAATGVDRISIGRLTHSAPAADLTLQWIET
jgi:nicotinate-nucleotide pyrophosphorylase (carboxylating)